MGRSTLDALTQALKPKCLNCGEHDAKVLPSLGRPEPMFCRIACAAHWAFKQAVGLKWCPRCQVWHGEVDGKRCLEEQKIALSDPRIPII